MKTCDPLYVSIHVPKTAGSTLGGILEERFGQGLQKAYNGDPVVENPACIHGHSVLDRFGDLIAAHGNCIWMTYLRDPLLSAISMYYFTRARSAVMSQSYFVDRGLQEWLTHSHPFQWPNPPGYNHNRFTKWIDRCGRSVEAFDFVGLTDRFDESVVLMYHQFDWPKLPFVSKNKGDYEKPSLDANVIERFKDLNASDYARHEEAALLLQQKQAAYGPTFREDLSRFQSEVLRTD